MSNQFSRTELLIGTDGLKTLSKSKVAIFGIGGVGGYTLEALARSGIGQFDIVDNDKICITNLNRQIYALRSTVGKYKVDVAKERILDINPNAIVNTYKTFYTPETSSDFDFSQYDYIIDAIDTVSGKIELVMQANKAGVKIISSMGAGNKFHPELFEIADIYKTSVCPLAKVMRQELKKRKVKHLKVVYSKELPVKSLCNSDGNLECPQEQICNVRKHIPGSISFVPSAVGLIIAGEVIRDLLNIK